MALSPVFSETQNIHRESSVSGNGQDAEEDTGDWIYEGEGGVPMLAAPWSDGPGPLRSVQLLFESKRHGRKRKVLPNLVFFPATLYGVGARAATSSGVISLGRAHPTDPEGAAGWRGARGNGGKPSSRAIRPVAAAGVHEGTPCREQARPEGRQRGNGCRH